MKPTFRKRNQRLGPFPSLLPALLIWSISGGIAPISHGQDPKPGTSPKEKLATCEVETCTRIAWDELVRQRPRAQAAEYTFVGLTFTHDPSQVLKKEYITVSFRKNEPVKTIVETAGAIKTTANFYEIVDIELFPSGRVTNTSTRSERQVDVGQKPTP